jgi:hypothetical protein
MNTFSESKGDVICIFFSIKKLFLFLIFSITLNVIAFFIIFYSFTNFHIIGGFLLFLFGVYLLVNFGVDFYRVGRPVLIFSDCGLKIQYYKNELLPWSSISDISKISSSSGVSFALTVQADHGVNRTITINAVGLVVGSRELEGHLFKYWERFKGTSDGQ